MADRSARILRTFKERPGTPFEPVPETGATRFDSWHHTTFAQRAVVGARAAFMLRERADELARLVTLEMGKSIQEAWGEVALSADIIDRCARQAEPSLSALGTKRGSSHAAVGNGPFAVVFCVQPWNCPYDQLARFTAPNLMAGKVVLVKHAGRVPGAATAFEKLWQEAGAPLGTYSNLLISYE